MLTGFMQFLLLEKLHMRTTHLPSLSSLDFASKSALLAVHRGHMGPGEDHSACIHVVHNQLTALYTGARPHLLSVHGLYKRLDTCDGPSKY